MLQDSTYYPGKCLSDLLSNYKLCAVWINQPFLTAESMAANTQKHGCRDDTGIPVIFPWQPFSQSLHDRPPAAVGTNWQSREALTRDAGRRLGMKLGDAESNGQLWSLHSIHTLISFTTVISAYFHLFFFTVNLPESGLRTACCDRKNGCFFKPTAYRQPFKRQRLHLQSKFADIITRVCCVLLLDFTELWKTLSLYYTQLH